MSKGILGSFNGVVTPNVNMVEIFRKNEISKHENSHLALSPFMTLKKIGIQCEPGTQILINGCNIPIVSGVFEIGYDQIDITSLVFDTPVETNIYYMY